MDGTKEWLIFLFVSCNCYEKTPTPLWNTAVFGLGKIKAADPDGLAALFIVSLVRTKTNML